MHEQASAFRAITSTSTTNAKRNIVIVLYTLTPDAVESIRLDFAQAPA
jgi:hypothetical protein